MGSKKLTIDFVRARFLTAGFTLTSAVYVNNTTKLNYVCLNGHNHMISWHAFNQGIRCPFCSNKAKKTYSDVKESFIQVGYTLLSTRYINAHTDLYYICDKGHKSTIRWANFQQGKRCGKCSGNVLLTYEEVVKIFDAEGYILISKEYIKSIDKLEYRCPQGHIHNITLGSFNSGVRCPTCATISTYGAGHWNWQGGKSIEPYCPVWSDKGYKADIRNRDNNVCQNPYCYKNDSLLHIHHIDYDKKNCHPSNLVTVCRACNARANFDRYWHKGWYQTIMSKKFKYKY